jgi:hypothetical protein
MRKLIRKIIDWARDDSTNMIDWSKAASSRSSGNNINNDSECTDGTSGINFVVYDAVGGKVVHLWTYDDCTDTKKVTLYIIASGEDFGEQISYILLREALSK